MKGFVVFALPRSRTAWTSHFLSYRGWTCGHDEMRHLRSLDDLNSWFSQPYTGTVETGAAPWWRLVPEGTRVATIRRPVGEVVDSLLRLELGFDRDRLIQTMLRLDAKLDQLEVRLPEVLRLEYSQLAEEAAAGALFEHCLGVEFDPAWWAHLSRVNIQINMSSMLRYCIAYAPQMERLRQNAKQKLFRQFEKRVKFSSTDVTFQQESFESFYKDGKKLFSQHLVDVGEAPLAYSSKNIELMEKLYSADALQITTARYKGQLVGYLMAIIAPSLESPNILDSAHLTFFVDPKMPGLGLKLQRASIEALRVRNVDDLYLRCGPRGSGPRMGKLYSRLGAEEHGQMFQLKLKEI